MRISDWSSDVCSSDLYNHVYDSGDHVDFKRPESACGDVLRGARDFGDPDDGNQRRSLDKQNGLADQRWRCQFHDRESVVEGKSGLVREDRGGGGIMKKKKTTERECNILR